MNVPWANSIARGVAVSVTCHVVRIVWCKVVSWLSADVKVCGARLHTEHHLVAWVVHCVAVRTWSLQLIAYATTWNMWTRYLATACAIERTQEVVKGSWTPSKFTKSWCLAFSIKAKFGYCRRCPRCPALAQGETSRCGTHQVISPRTTCFLQEELFEASHSKKTYVSTVSNISFPACARAKKCATNARSGARSS